MITGVSVKGLFGTFDHEVELNGSEGVTILAAPNGYGKSTLLRMIKLAGGASFAELAQVPFATFSVRDDQGRELLFSRKLSERKRSSGPDAEGVIEFDDWPEDIADVQVSGRPVSRVELTVRREGSKAKPLILGVFPVSDSGSNLVLGPAMDARLRHQRGRFELEQMSARERRRLMERYGRHPRELPEWLRRRIESMKVMLIESQRLLEPEPESPRRPREAGPASIPAVTAIRNDLVERIRRAKIAYVRKSGDIDRTFPTRFLELARSGNQQLRSTSELRERLHELDEKRAALQAVGILEREALPALGISDDIPEPYIQALSLLVGDIESKLSHFDDLEGRIALLKELANARFQFKTLEVDAERGLHCASEGRDIPLVQLSSGEQHELVLFYDALFRAEPGSLLMIDEPELSLHAAWQSEFINDLRRILTLSGGAVLIATHSSALIGGSWDLVVELGGPQSGLHS